MKRTNRNWLPAYLDPSSLLPRIPETRALFSRSPYLVQDFVGKAISFLRSEEIKKLGFEYDEASAIPCKWKCSDESLFGVDLAMYAHTAFYPFDKGLIGGYFNEDSLKPALHHGRINVDLGGSHVGYVPGDGGGAFGKIWRPATKEYSADCGHLMGVVAPFERVYDDACTNILLYQPPDERLMVSVPNEFVQPSWSHHNVKLLVDLDRFTDGEVEYHQERKHTHTLIGRSLFYVHPEFVELLPPEDRERMSTPQYEPIGRNLVHRYFDIFDKKAPLDEEGLPRQRLLLYMKYILSARHSPAGLKAAVINTALEHNRLTDAVRNVDFENYGFVSLSGMFIDLYDHEINSYVNLIQPMGMTIKPQGISRGREFTFEEIHEILDSMPLATPRMPLREVLGYDRPVKMLEQYTFKPGHFIRE
jgi:hypothetical protein